MSGGMQCPVCGESDRTARVSAVYMAAIEMKFGKQKNAIPVPAGEMPDFSVWEELATEGIAALGKRLAPPSGGKQAPLRPVHPDWVVGAFSLLAPVFLYGILTSQPQALWAVVPLLVGFYALYFWRRRLMIDKYQGLLAGQRTQEVRVRRGIERWLRLYYCARDDVVFSGAGKDARPADELLHMCLD